MITALVVSVAFTSLAITPIAVCVPSVAVAFIILIRSSLSRPTTVPSLRFCPFATVIWSFEYRFDASYFKRSPYMLKTSS